MKRYEITFINIKKIVLMLCLTVPTVYVMAGEEQILLEFQKLREEVKEREKQKEKEHIAQVQQNHSTYDQAPQGWIAEQAQKKTLVQQPYAGVTSSNTLGVKYGFNPLLSSKFDGVKEKINNKSSSTGRVENNPLHLELGLDFITPFSENNAIISTQQQAITKGVNSQDQKIIASGSMRRPLNNTGFSVALKSRVEPELAVLNEKNDRTISFGDVSLQGQSPRIMESQPSVVERMSRSQMKAVTLFTDQSLHRIDLLMKNEGLLKIDAIDQAIEEAQQKIKNVLARKNQSDSELYHDQKLIIEPYQEVVNRLIILKQQEQVSSVNSNKVQGILKSGESESTRVKKLVRFDDQLNKNSIGFSAALQPSDVTQPVVSKVLLGKEKNRTSLEQKSIDLTLQAQSPNIVENSVIDLKQQEASKLQDEYERQVEMYTKRYLDSINNGDMDLDLMINFLSKDQNNHGLSKDFIPYKKDVLVRLQEFKQEQEQLKAVEQAKIAQDQVKMASQDQLQSEDVRKSPESIEGDIFYDANQGPEEFFAIKQKDQLEVQDQQLVDQVMKNYQSRFEAILNSPVEQQVVQFESLFFEIAQSVVAKSDIPQEVQDSPEFKQKLQDVVTSTSYDIQSSLIQDSVNVENNIVTKDFTLKRIFSFFMSKLKKFMEYFSSLKIVQLQKKLAAQENNQSALVVADNDNSSLSKKSIVL